MKVLFKTVLLSLLSLAIDVSDKSAIGCAISQIVRNQFVNTWSDLRIVKYSGESTEIDAIANEIVERSEKIDTVRNYRFATESVEKIRSQSVCCSTTGVRFWISSIRCGSKSKASRPSTSSHITKLKPFWTELKIETHVCHLGKCRKLIQNKVNEFSKSEMKWKSHTFSLKQCGDFHGCHIEVKMSSYHPFHEIVNNTNSINNGFLQTASISKSWIFWLKDWIFRLLSRTVEV